MIEDSYCQGPKPKESESCASRRRREDVSAADGKHDRPSSARSNTAARQNGFIKVARDSTAETALGDVAANRCDRREFSRTGQAAGENTPLLPSSIGAKHVDTLWNTRAGSTRPTGSENPIMSREVRLQPDKRSDGALNNDDDEEKVSSARKIKKGQVVIDKEDIRNLTLTIIVERDDQNVVANFPKDFEPQPPANSTEFTLTGMDALRYIQRIQEEAR